MVNAYAGLLVRDCINLERWAALETDILDCEADSHVGQNVVVLLAQLSAILDSQTELEPRYEMELIDMGLRQSRIWLFG